MDAWKKDEEVACEADIAEIKLKIIDLEKELIERKMDRDATIKEAAKRSEEWIQEKERAIKDALPPYRP